MAQRWEYKVVQSLFPLDAATRVGQPRNDNPEEELNEEAGQGWELHCVVAFTRADGMITINHYLKREVKPPA